MPTSTDRLVRALVLFVSGAGAAWCQSGLQLSSANLTFRMVASGVLPPGQTVNVTAQSATPWNAAVSGADSDGFSVSANSGSTPGTLTVNIVGWWGISKPPGNYSATVTVTPKSGGTGVSLPVAITIVASTAAPTFSYIAGPTGCQATDGYPDPAICTVPNEKPPGNFAPPATGSTYVDPNFGATIRVLTDPGCLHDYSNPTAISAHNRYVMVSCKDGTKILSTANSKVVYNSVTVNWNRGTVWDAYDDEVYYYLKDAKIIRYNLKSGKSSTLVDYATSSYKFSAITMEGTGDTSKDNWLAFWAPNETNLCVIDLNKVKTYCGNYSGTGGLPYNKVGLGAGGGFATVSKGVDTGSGKRYVILEADPAIGVFSVNLAKGTLDFEYRGPEDPEGNGNHNGTCDPGESCLLVGHHDTFEDASGIQYLVANAPTNNPCEFAFNTYQLDKGVNMRTQVELGGGRKKVMTLFQCQGNSKVPVVWTEDHLGCAKSAPFCVISTNYGGNRNPADKTPIVRTPHMSEIIVVRGNGDEIRRVAEHRSVLYSGEDPYWSTPRASISNDGGFVVADSNFGNTDPTNNQLSQRVILIDTGFSRPPKLNAGGVVNAASPDAGLAPGGIVSIYGTDLGGCTLQAAAFPLPTTLCGPQVSFNGVPAPFFFASPNQLNVMMPSAAPLGQDVHVTVERPLQPTSEVVVPAAQVGEEAPAIFNYSMTDGVPRAVLINPDASLNGPAGSDLNTRPLRPGEWAVMYANALGPTNPVVDDGQPAPGAEPLARTLRTVSVYVNDVSQKVAYAGLAPFYAALFQVNFQLDPKTPLESGDNNKVWLAVNSVLSPRLAISLSQ